MKRLLFITGTDTGAGKTVLTALLARAACARGRRIAALKPVCSGGRDDARVLFRALDGALSLDTINPWHFRAPIAPVLAARLEKKKLKLRQVAAPVRALRKQFDLLLVEGAGGLLSPLGEDFDSRDLITALGADPVVVAPNRLGVINQLRLALEALPPKARRRAFIVLMDPARPDAATRSNAGLLGEFFDRRRIVSLPWFGKKFNAAAALKKSGVRRALARLSR